MHVCFCGGVATAGRTPETQKRNRYRKGRMSDTGRKYLVLLIKLIPTVCSLVRHSSLPIMLRNPFSLLLILFYVTCHKIMQLFLFQFPGLIKQCDSVAHFFVVLLCHNTAIKNLLLRPFLTNLCNN